LTLRAGKDALLCERRTWAGGSVEATNRAMRDAVSRTKPDLCSGEEALCCPDSGRARPSGSIACVQATRAKTPSMRE
jgi:hypothetical protein